MLDKAVPRSIDDSLRGDQTVADYQQEQTEKLAEYGHRLYGFLFGDGKELQSFLKYNDAYAQRAHLTLALHSSAAILWRLPWEYIHDGKDFLALHGKFQLSRRPYELGKLERDPVQLPLRLLIIISAPDDATELNTEKEISAHPEGVGRGRTARPDSDGISGRRHPGGHRGGAQTVQPPCGALHRTWRLP